VWNYHLGLQPHQILSKFQSHLYNPECRLGMVLARYSDMTKLQGAATVASAALAIGSRLSGKFSSEKSRNAIKNNDKG
jgi:hypothetical protein